MSIESRIHEPGIERAVRTGLTAEHKFLSDWLLLDEKGQELLEEIYRLPEYYPVTCKKEIFSIYSRPIAQNFRQESKRWNIVEMTNGSGDISPSIVPDFLSEGIELGYYPVVRPGVVHHNLLSFEDNFFVQHSPFYDINDTLRSTLPLADPILFFLRDTADNLEVNDLTMLLKKISAQLRRKDRIILMLDLMKSPSVIEKAYHDYKGVTTLFHKNVLTRINRELEGNFDLKQFEYWCIYDAVTGTCRRYLVSVRKQTVRMNKIDVEVSFKPWETIFTGLSQKYHEDRISILLQMTGLVAEKALFDRRKFCSLLILKSA